MKGSSTNTNSNSSNTNSNGSSIEKHVDDLPDDGWLDDVHAIDSSPDWDGLKDTPINATWINGFVSYLKKTSPESPNYERDELERVGLSSPLAILYVVTYIGLIIYFTYTGALDDSQRKFLSLVYMNNLDIECVEIPMLVSGQYGLDRSGRWSSESLFLANESRHL